jgi:hypothetical protein
VFSISLLVILFFISFIECQQKCNIPATYFGDWYSQEGGADVRTNIDALLWSRVSTPQEKLECVDIYLHKQERSILSQLNNVTFLLTFYKRNFKNPR